MGGMAELDVSAVGTLVWVRRPNGSWWPGRVVSPLEVPDGFPAPPRSPATPIVLLGRRDGPGFVDWCNLERTKRVKPFRCGEFDLENSIRKAEEQAARRSLSNRARDKMVAVTARYARREDAILQALDIERARLRDAAPTTKNRQGIPSKFRLGNGVIRKSSHFSSILVPSSPAANPPSPKRKRKTPNDSEDDVPQGFRRMRDLTDIGSNTTAKHNRPNADTFSCLNYDLPSTSQMKRSKPSHHSTAKRKPAIVDEDLPCGISRKKDRSRPLSELCNGDLWNGFRPNGPKADEHLMDMGTCSGSSTATSSLDTLFDKPSTRRPGLFNTDQAKGTEISCMTGLVCDDSLHEDELVNAPLAAGSILKADHSDAHPPCASTEDPIWKCSKQAADCSKADICSRGDGRNSKKKTISSVGHEGSNRTGNALEGEHRKARVVKHKAPSNEVVLSEESVGKGSFDGSVEPGDYKDLAIIHEYLDCVDAVVQQCPETKRGIEEPFETVTNSTNCENVSVSSQVFELPLEQHKDPVVAKCDEVKPTETLRLNSAALYDVELSAQGCSSTKGRHVPLVSLMSRWNRGPVVGYPVSVEVLDDVICCPPASSVDDHHISTSSGNGLLKKDEADHHISTSSGNGLLKKDEAPVPRHVRPSSSHKGRTKPKICRKTSEDEMDKSWRPHTKKPASSPRKMRRLSSFAASRRGGEDHRKSAAGKFSGPAVACIPLRVVFSRINEALSYPVK